VLDYKSSQKQLDSLLIEHGLQLQLLAYLNVLQQWPEPRQWFSVERLIPAGVFYVSLRGRLGAEANRREALTESDQKRQAAYQHTGRFDIQALPHLDSRPGATRGTQFNYRRVNDGSIHGSCREPLPTEEFRRLLGSAQSNLVRMGQEIYSGAAAINPYRKGSVRACDHCAYQSICRVDPWTHPFRVLSRQAAP
jgi:ATP-dependent helicase/nuclease subunit B